MHLREARGRVLYLTILQVRRRDLLHFERKELVTRSMAHEVHDSRSSCTKKPELLKVLQTGCCLFALSLRPSGAHALLSFCVVHLV